MDRISTLPDEILGHILSFLPTKQAASTSLLSKRWRNVFVLVSSLDLHYDFDHSRRYWLYKDCNRRRNFMDFVDSLLSLQGNSPIIKLALKIYASDLDPIRVQNWICNVLERGVVDLNLYYQTKNQLLSSLIFKNNTLVKLRLGTGFKINLSQDVYLPKLKTLCLGTVDFAGVHDVFETLLPRCPVLEELIVDDQLWVKGHSSVSSRSLKKLIIGFHNIQTMSFDVPNLVYLELLCFSRRKYVIVNLDSLVEARLCFSVGGKQLQELIRRSVDLVPADKIDIIIQMRNVRVLHLTSGFLEMFYFTGQELPIFDNLVRLCISKHGWRILPLLIKNSPNLETLILRGLDHNKTTNSGDACVCSGFKENISCYLSSCRIKVLEIWFYRGTLREVNQMKHFLEKLQCLEMVNINAVNNPQVPKYIQELLNLPRASSNCKIQAVF